MRAQLTPEEIAALAEPAQSAWSFGISPDGKHLAFAAREQSQLCLYVVDLDRPAERRRLTVGWDLPPDEWSKPLPAKMFYVLWKDNRRILFRQKYDGFHAVDLDGKNQILLKQDIGAVRHKILEVASLLPHEPDSILGTADGEFFRVNVRTGKSMHLGYFGERVLVDQMGVLRGSCNVNREIGIEEYLVFKGLNGRDILLHELLGKELSAQYGWPRDLVNDVFRGARAYSFGFWKECLLFVSNQKRDTYALYMIDLSKKAVEGPLLANPKFDVNGSLIFVPQQRNLGGMRCEDVQERTTWFLPEFVAAQKALDALLPQRVNRICGWDDSLRRFAVFSYSDRDPGSIAFYDAQDGKVQRLGSIKPEISFQRTAPTLATWVKCKAGHEVLCYLTMPADYRKGERRPLVVLLHDGPWTRDTWGFDGEVQRLAAEGYLVLQVNFRGSAGFGYAHVSAARRRFGEAAEEDVAEAVDWAVQSGAADPRRIYAYGGGFGGYLAAYAAACRPDLWRGCISITGIMDLEDFVAGGNWNRRTMDSWMRYDIRRQLIGDPGKDKAALRGASPVHLAKKITAPVLLIHGEKDGDTRIDHHDRMRRKLEAAGRAPEFLEIKEAQIEKLTPAQQRQIWDAIVAFLRKHDSSAATTAAK
ncbi:MAG: S9 family peptidase [Opitutae bacterium]|nr:S9 family peptidase [Opitutae bacterium]